MCARVRVYHLGMEQPIRGTNASCYNSLKQASLSAVLADVVGGTLGRKIVHGGLAIDLCRDPHHVFAMPFWLGAVSWQRLVDSLSEVTEAGVAGSFPNARGKVRGVRRVKWKLGAVRKG